MLSMLCMPGLVAPSLVLLLMLLILVKNLSTIFAFVLTMDLIMFT